MDAPELVRLLAGHGMQKPSPCLDLKVPGLQAGKNTQHEHFILNSIKSFSFTLSFGQKST